MYVKEVTAENQVGLHARPATFFIQMCIRDRIYSMTKEEREKPSIINPKRKRRIAAGSGTRCV